MSKSWLKYKLNLGRIMIDKQSKSRCKGNLALLDKT
jgi:hypothetical protein